MVRGAPHLEDTAGAQIPKPRLRKYPGKTERRLNALVLDGSGLSQTICDRNKGCPLPIVMGSRLSALVSEASKML